MLEFDTRLKAKTNAEHISNIYSKGKLIQNETFRNSQKVSNEPIKHYNLDMVKPKHPTR